MTTKKTAQSKSKTQAAKKEGRLSSGTKIKVNSKDVIFGRGHGANNHAGNTHFRNTVRAHKDAYNKCSLNMEKSKLAEKVMSIIVEGGGRFLEPRENGGGYQLVAADRAHQKVQQALREKRNGWGDRGKTGSGADLAMDQDVANVGKSKKPAAVPTKKKKPTKRTSQPKAYATKKKTVSHEPSGSVERLQEMEDETVETSNGGAIRKEPPTLKNIGEVVEIFDLEQNDILVGFGRGHWRAAREHFGNQRLHILVGTKEWMEAYEKAPNGKKIAVARGLIAEHGGRFVEEQNGRYFLVDPREAEKKVCQDFRDCLRPLRAQAQKTKLASGTVTKGKEKTTLRATDVVLGVGGSRKNLRFCSLVAEYTEAYADALDGEKGEIIRQVLSDAGETGIRFVEKIGNRHYLASYKQGYNKVHKALEYGSLDLEMTTSRKFSSKAKEKTNVAPTGENEEPSAANETSLEDGGIVSPDRAPDSAEAPAKPAFFFVANTAHPAHPLYASALKQTEPQGMTGANEVEDAGDSDSEESIMEI